MGRFGAGHVKAPAAARQFVGGWRRALAAWVCALGGVLGLLAAGPALAAVVIQYEVTSLGGDDWRYDYVVKNDGSVSELLEFTIHFELGLTSNLAVVGSPADWDSLVAQPDGGIPADGFFDSLALAGGLLAGDSLGGFSVSFTWTGAGTPGAQAFDIVDPVSFEVLGSGTTQSAAVPEPAPWLLMLAAGAVALLLSRRRRWLALAGAGALLITAGCGGGAGPSAAPQAETARMRALAVGAGNGLAGVQVDALVLKAERRVTRTVYEYDYRLRIANGGAALAGVTVELVGVGAGTQIVEPVVVAGVLPAGQKTTPADTITIRHDRSKPLSLAGMSWNFAVAPVVQGTAAVGAALANAKVTVIDTAKANACYEAPIYTSGVGQFTCTVRPGLVAPLLVVVGDPQGSYAPMVSIVEALPPSGSALVANATPLTNAIVSQLAPNGNALALLDNPSLIDLAKLATIKANVLAQLAGVLAAVGAPPGYDPFTTPIVAATPSQAGNTADHVIEMLKFSSVAGVNHIGTIDNPTGVPLAGLAPGAVLPPPSPGALALGSTMQMMANAFKACFAVPVNQRVLATDTSIPATSGGPEVTLLGAACQNHWHADYRNSGYRAGQRHYGLLRDSAMTGATFSLPEIMLYRDDTSAADNDIAVLNFRFLDANGIALNTVEVARKLPGSATAAHPSDWWLHGNRSVIDAVIRSFVRRGVQYAPNPGTPPFQLAGLSRFDTGIEIYINKDGPNSIGLRAARVTGPGLPPPGVVLTRPNPAFITDQTWLGIKNKNGNTDPAVATFTNDGNVFLLQRSLGLTGSAATTVRPNPNNGNSNNTQFMTWAHPLDYGFPIGSTNFIDFTQLGAGNTYSVEYFYDGEIAPRYIDSKTMLTPITQAISAWTLQWIENLTPATLGYLDPFDPKAQALTTMNLEWAANPFAETVSSAGVYTSASGQVVNDSVVFVARGATTAQAIAPQGASFKALTADGTSSRNIQLRYRMLDGSYKDSTWRYN